MAQYLLRFLSSPLRNCDPIRSAVSQRGSDTDFTMPGHAKAFQALCVEFFNRMAA
jgi:hypothetical protein